MISEEEKEWLIANLTLFVKASIPALDILDVLVSAHVFLPTADDYQVITTEATLSGHIRKIMDALPSKPRSSSAFRIFISALEKLCPHVLKACTHCPSDLLEKLDEELHCHFKTIDQEEPRPFSRLMEDEAGKPITISHYIRHLAVVDEPRADKIISEQITSSATENRRCE